MTEAQETPLMTAQEIGSYLKLSPASIYRLVAEKRIPAIRLGVRTLRFELSAVMEALTDNIRGADEQCE